LGAAHEPLVIRAGHDLDPARLQSRTALVDAANTAQRAFEVCEEEKPGDPATARALNQVFSPRAKEALDVTAERDDIRRQYGSHTFGQSCLLARRLIERGTRLVTVNMFDTVFGALSWDCHADGGSLPTTLDDYRDTLCPMFDQTYTA